MWRSSSAAEKLLASLKGLFCIGFVLTMPGGRFGMAETSSLLGSYAVSSGVINTDVSNNRNAFICNFKQPDMADADTATWGDTVKCKGTLASCSESNEAYFFTNFKMQYEIQGIPSPSKGLFLLTHFLSLSLLVRRICIECYKLCGPVDRL